MSSPEPERLMARLAQGCSLQAYKRPIHVYSDFTHYNRYTTGGVIPIFIMNNTSYVLLQISRNTHQGARCFGMPRLGVFKGRKSDEDKNTCATAVRETAEETAYTLSIDADQLISTQSIRHQTNNLWFVFITVDNSEHFLKQWWRVYINNQRRHLEDIRVYEIDTVGFVPLFNVSELWGATRMCNQALSRIRRWLGDGRNAPVYRLISHRYSFSLNSPSSRHVSIGTANIDPIHRYDVTYFHTVLRNFPKNSRFGMCFRIKLSRLLLGHDAVEDEMTRLIDQRIDELQGTMGHWLNATIDNKNSHEKDIKSHESKVRRCCSTSRISEAS